MIQEHADPLYSYTTVITDSPRSDKTCNVNWLSDECLNLKEEFLSCLNVFRNIKTDKLRKKMVKARSKYSTCARKCRYDHDRRITLRLQQTEKSNIREFWKILRPKNEN